MWSGLKVKKKKHLAITFLNSCFEKEDYLMVSHCDSLLRKVILIDQFLAKL